MTHWTNWCLHCPNKRSHFKHKSIPFCRNQFYYLVHCDKIIITRYKTSFPIPPVHKHQWVKHKGFQSCQPNSYSTVKEFTKMSGAQSQQKGSVRVLSQGTQTRLSPSKGQTWQTSCRQEYSVFHIPLAIWSTRWKENKISACPTAFRWSTWGTLWGFCF